MKGEKGHEKAVIKSKKAYKFVISPKKVRKKGISHSSFSMCYPKKSS